MSVRSAITSAAGLAHAQRVLVLANADKSGVGELVAELVPWLEQRVEVTLELDARSYHERRANHAAPPDLCVVLGGDGAILGAVRAFESAPVPTLGINLGRVGFLASAESSQWREALEDVLAGRAVLEPRLRLEAEYHALDGKVARAVALNDVVVTRGAFQGLLMLSLSVDGAWVTNYRADGLIVSTPSGSTAYCLAAGGPILAPTTEVVCVVPVCPQSLAHRPIVLSADSVLELVVREASGLTTLVVDGQGFFPMQPGDSVHLRRHPVAYPILARPGFDPYRRWRERLGWGGSLERDSSSADRSNENDDSEVHNSRL